MKKSLLELLLFLPISLLLAIGSLKIIEESYSWLQTKTDGFILIVAYIVVVIIISIVLSLTAGLIWRKNLRLFQMSLGTLVLYSIYVCIFKEYSLSLILIIVGFNLYYTITVKNILNQRLRTL